MAIVLGPRLPSPQDWAANQIQASQNAGQKWLEHTLHPTKDPIAEAKKAEGVWAANTQKAIQEKAFGKGLARVDTDAMQATIQQVGAGGFTAGIANRADKIQKAVARVHALQLENVRQIDAMPNATDADREARVLANLRNMRAMRAKLRG